MVPFCSTFSERKKLFRWQWKCLVNLSNALSPTRFVFPGDWRLPIFLSTGLCRDSRCPFRVPHTCRRHYIFRGNCEKNFLYFQIIILRNKESNNDCFLVLNLGLWLYNFVQLIRNMMRRLNIWIYSILCFFSSFKHFPSVCQLPAIIRYRYEVLASSFIVSATTFEFEVSGPWRRALTADCTSCWYSYWE